MTAVHCIRTEYWTDGTYTVAQAKASTLPKPSGTVGIGVAKRNPRDDEDEVLGRQLAYARALHDLADKLEARATS